MFMSGVKFFTVAEYLKKRKEKKMKFCCFRVGYKIAFVHTKKGKAEESAKACQPLVLNSFLRREDIQRSDATPKDLSRQKLSVKVPHPP